MADGIDFGEDDGSLDIPEGLANKIPQYSGWASDGVDRDENPRRDGGYGDSEPSWEAGWVQTFGGRGADAVRARRDAQRASDGDFDFDEDDWQPQAVISAEDLRWNMNPDEVGETTRRPVDAHASAEAVGEPRRRRRTVRGDASRVPREKYSDSDEETTQGRGLAVYNDRRRAGSLDYAPGGNDADENSEVTVPEQMREQAWGNGAPVAEDGDPSSRSSYDGVPPAPVEPAESPAPENLFGSDAPENRTAWLRQFEDGKIVEDAQADASVRRPRPPQLTQQPPANQQDMEPFAASVPRPDGGMAWQPPYGEATSDLGYGSSAQAVAEDETGGANGAAGFAMVAAVMAVLLGMVPALGVYLFPIPMFSGIVAGAVGLSVARRQGGAGRTVARGAIIVSLVALLVTLIVQAALVALGIVSTSVSGGMMTLTFSF